MEASWQRSANTVQAVTTLMINARWQTRTDRAGID